MRPIRDLHRFLGFVAGVFFLACSSSGSDGGNTSGGAISITLGSASTSIAQGGTGQVTATLTRSGGFTGTVNLSVEGTPSGVTGVISNVTTSGDQTTGIVSITVAGSATPGSYTLTVRGTGTGVSDATRSFTLTITAAGTGYTIGVSPSAISILQGGNGTVAVTLTRTNFTGSVNLSGTNLPAGVTATFSPNNITTSSSTMTITVGAAVAAGQYTIFVGGVAAGVSDKVTPITLTVAAAGTYTLSVAPTSVSIAQGATGNATVTLTRAQGFAASVSLTVTGAPAGLTATLTPSSTTGSTSTLGITAGSGLAAGNYTLTVHGASTGVAEQVATVGVTVTTGGGGGGGNGNVTLDYRNCDPAQQPIWLAFQDGAGAWTRVTGSNNVYSFTISSGKGGYIYVTQTGADMYGLNGQFLTQSEFTAGGTFYFCSTGTKSIGGSVVNLASNESASIGLGNAGATASQGTPNFLLTKVADGPQDLVAWRRDPLLPGSDERGFLRRDVNLANNGSVGAIDFSGAESFTPVSATLTAANVGGELVTIGTRYLTGANCAGSGLFTGAASVGTTQTMYGVPGALQRSTDYHSVYVTTIGASTNRSVIEAFHTMANRTVTMPANMPTPTLSVLSAAYKRLQAVYTVPADYNASTSLLYYDLQGKRTVSLAGSFGYFGSHNITFAVPDLSAVSGWNDSWGPTTGVTVYWNVGAAYSNLATSSQCVEGGRIAAGYVFGQN